MELGSRRLSSRLKRAWPACEACGWGQLPETVLGMAWSCPVLGLGFSSTVGDPAEEAMPFKLLKSGICRPPGLRLQSAEAVEIAILSLDPSPAAS